MGPTPEDLWKEVRGLCSSGVQNKRGNRSIRTQITPAQPRLQGHLAPTSGFPASVKSLVWVLVSQPCPD